MATFTPRLSLHGAARPLPAKAVEPWIGGVMGSLSGALSTLAQPERAVNRAVLASVLAIVVISNLVSLPLYRLIRPAGGLQSFGGFLVAALALEITLLTFLALTQHAALVRWLVSGLPAGTWRRLPGWLFHGLLAGPLLFAVSALVQVTISLAFGVQQTQLAEYLWLRGLPAPQFLVVLFVGAAVAPLAEEWFFRGYVFRAYLKARGPLWAYLASAGLFALLHLNLPAAPPIFAMGLVLAWLYQRTGALLPCIVAHGLNNAVALTAVYVVSALP